MDWNPIDTAMTPWRQKIYGLVRDELKIGVGAKEGCFDCKYFDEREGEDHRGCNQSVPNGLARGRLGDWPYVGRHYGEAFVSGRKAKVLIVSLDRPDGGSGDTTLTFEGRQMVSRDGTLRPKNPHMHGVAVELKRLLDKEVAGKEVRAEDRCQQFALINAVFCGRPSGSMRSKSTPVMKNNCREHVRRIVQALEPDIVIAQSGAAKQVCRSFFSRTKKRFARKTLPAWATTKPPGRNRVSEVAAGEIRGRAAWFVLTAHPSFYQWPLGLRFWDHDSWPDELSEAFDFVQRCWKESSDSG